MHINQYFNKKFSFRIVGKPIPQKRHRHTSTGKFVRTYDPSKDDKATFLKKCLVQRDPLEYKWIKPLEHNGYVEIFIDFCMPIPKSTSKKKTAEILSDITYHSKRPDIDNLIKFVLDALSGHFWNDDAVVAKITAHKIYDSCPRTEFEIIYRGGLQN